MLHETTPAPHPELDPAQRRIEVDFLFAQFHLNYRLPAGQIARELGLTVAVSTKDEQTQTQKLEDFRIEYEIRRRNKMNADGKIKTTQDGKTVTTEEHVITVKQIDAKESRTPMYEVFDGDEPGWLINNHPPTESPSTPVRTGDPTQLLEIKQIFNLLMPLKPDQTQD
jgi:hypothetical protein